MTIAENKDRFMSAVGKVVPISIFTEEGENAYTFQVQVDDAIGVFGIRVVILEDAFRVLTCCWLKVDKENEEKMNRLFYGLNQNLDRGKFAISTNNDIFHTMEIGYKEIECIDNPYELILKGTILFNKYHRTIFKALGED